MYMFVISMLSLFVWLTFLHIVAAVGFSQNLFEADETDGEVEICLRKDLVTASAFTVTLTPQETAPNPPETFRARGKALFINHIYT